jgi:redox-sensitive bicupin YhaK (pirin superfamily)
MLTIRRAAERGYANHGWLESWHSFSFADYHDPAHVHFGSLRVINEDTVQAGQGFPTHGHRDMEILSYVLEGTLEHQDSMGNGTQIRYGDVQVMSAGTGVRHSEFNPSATEAVHFLQIWIMPDTHNLTPMYQQKQFSAEDKRERWCLLASAQGEAGSMLIHQDARIYAAVLAEGKSMDYAIKSPRKVYLHVVRGSVTLNGHALGAGDAAKLSEEGMLSVSASAQAELLLFDLV